MIARIAVTLGVLVFGALLPILEIGPTHVFNPAWPPHARLHEVWQLVTNSALTALCLWLVWRRGVIWLPSLIGLCVMGGVLVAHGLEARYGGALLYAGGPTASLLGANLAQVIPALAVALFGLALAIDRAQPSRRVGRGL